MPGSRHRGVLPRPLRAACSAYAGPRSFGAAGSTPARAALAVAGLLGLADCERPGPLVPDVGPVGCDPAMVRDKTNDVPVYDEAERAACDADCEAGSEAACLARAVMAAFEDPARDVEAVETFARLCSTGYTPACTPLAVSVGVGRGALVDRRRAVALLESGCGAGDSSACLALAAWHARGRLVPLDATRARTLAETWCDRGDAFACAGLGSLYASPDLGLRDDDKSYDLLTGSCAYGVGCAELAVLQFLPGPHHDLDAATPLAARLCHAGYMRPCRLLALVDLGATSTEEAPAAIALARDACAADRADACRQLDGAFGWLKRACDGGEQPSCGLLEGDPPRLHALEARGCAAGRARDCVTLAARALGASADDAHARSDAEARLDALCDAGSAGACTAIGAHRLRTAGRDAAFERLERGCQLRDAHACALAASVLEPGGPGWRPRPWDDAGRDATDAATDADDEPAGGAGTPGVPDALGPAPPPDPERAAAFARKGCLGGDAEGCALLAAHHYEGRGTLADAELAARLFEDGCDRGVGASCLGLGDLVYFGRLGRRDDALALALYERGCELGSALGCSHAGFLDAQRPGSDRAHSLTLLRRACAGGANAGCTNLADLHGEVAEAADALDRRCRARDFGSCTALGRLRAQHPEAGNADTVRALFAWACDAGDADGCANLGLFRLQGLLGPEDAEGAVVPLVRACRAEHAPACATLGRMAADGMGMTADPPRARRLFERACAQGAAEGCTALGLVRERAGELADAASLFADGCAQGHAPACRERGRMLLAGLGHASDPGAAAEAFERSALLGDETAARRLFQLQTDGWLSLARLRADLERACDADSPNFAACNSLGVVLAKSSLPRERAMAAARYDKACHGGVPRACKNLGVELLCRQPNAVPKAPPGTPPDAPPKASADRDAARALFERACHPPLQPAPLRRLPEHGQVEAPFVYEPLESACMLLHALELPARDFERVSPCREL